MLRLIPIAVLLLLLAPIAVGTAIVLLSALGWAPEFNARTTNLEMFSAVLQAPGMWHSVWLSYWVGLIAALVSLGVVILFVAAFIDTRGFRLISAAIKPVLAVPHAAAAFGLLFLIAPSGFLVRLISPELTGFMRPPDWLIVNDPGGFTMLAGLIIKEIPFLFFVTMAALPQTDPRRAEIATSLGFGRIWGWLISVFPAIYSQIRLPVFAVIVFATSTIDVALVLGPVNPPPLAVRVLQWMNDPDVNLRLTAAAGALVQLGVTLAALLSWFALEKLVALLARMATLRGWRFQRDRLVAAFAGGAISLSVGLVLLGIVLLLIWSFTGMWRFPNLLPDSWTVSSWNTQGANIFETGRRAFIIALAAASFSLVLVLASLENEYRGDIKINDLTWWVIYVPLLVPQIAFIGGLSFLFLRLGIDGTLWAVVLVHMVFVYPYVYLTLADPWNAFDTRFLAVARTLGKSVNRVFWTIRLPMLLRPVLASFALGFAVSIAQYLPTLLIGAGRQPTITTEAIALAAGGNRRLIGIYALMQTLMPFVIFALASLVPRYMWRNRRALQVGGAR